ncbi:unnamed protein product, partial [Ostreobium quekettii]
ALAEAQADGYGDNVSEALAEANAEAIAKCLYPLCRGLAADCCNGGFKSECACRG